MGVRRTLVAATVISLAVPIILDAAPVVAACPDINVAAGDGGAGLNAAIEAADACLGPQTITVEPGTYTSSSPFRIDDEVMIVAADPLVLPVITGSTTYAFVVTRSGPVELRDLDVRGSFRTGLMSVVDSTVLLDNVDFTGVTSGCGVSTFNAIRADATNLTMRSSDIVGSGCDGISAFNDSTVVLDDVVLAEHGQRGIRLAGSLVATSSEFRNNGRAGIDATGATTTVDLTDSFVYGNATDGISASSISLTVRRTVIGLGPDGAGGLRPAGNGERGIDSSFGDLVLDDVEVAHNAIGLTVGSPLSASITASSITDNNGSGLDLARASIELATTELANNAPNCTFFQSSVIDGGGNSDDDGTCGVVSNSAPEARSDSYVVDADGSLTIPAPGVLGNDSDPDGDPITAVPLAIEGVNLAVDGSFTYVPPVDTVGEQTFSYQVTDGSLTDTATITIDVRPEPAGGIHTWTTAGLDPASACNPSYSYDSAGIPTGSLALDVGVQTDVWLCVSILNQTNRTLETHDLVADPDLGAAAPAPRFALEIAPGEIAQQKFGPLSSELASAIDQAGWDLVWVVDTPTALPPIESRSSVEIRPDVDDLPTVFAESATTTESGDLAFTLTLRRPESVEPVAEDASVRVRTHGQTATDVDDFVVLDQVVNFSGGGTQTVIVDVIDDTIVEQDETLLLTLADPSGADVAASATEGTIRDDDGSGGGGLAVRVGRTADSACDGPLDTAGSVPAGQLVLPPGGSPEMPLFYCVGFTMPAGPDGVVHLLGVDGVDPSALPFAAELPERLGPGRTIARVVGPIAGLPSAQWTWTAVLEGGGFVDAAATTDVTVEDYVGALTLDVGMVPDSATPCTEAVDPLLVPWADGPGSPTYSASYCATVTNVGDAPLLTNGIAFDWNGSSPITKPVPGALAAGETRTVWIGPRSDHPEGPDLVHPREVQWVASGPSYIDGLDDDVLVTADDVATVEQTLEGAPPIFVGGRTVPELDVDSRPVDISIARGPGLLAAVDVTISVRPVDTDGTVPVPGPVCAPGVDYVATDDERTIDPDVVPSPYPIIVCGDRVDEGDERLQVEVVERLGDGSLGDVLASGIVRIADEDAPLRTLGIPRFDFAEQDGLHQRQDLVIDLVEPAESDRVLIVAVAGDGQTVVPCDFGGDLFLPPAADGSTTLQVDRGSTEVTVRSSVCSDGFAEPTETFEISFIDFFTNELQFTATVTIQDDDTFPVISGRTTEDWEDALDNTAVAEFDVLTAPEIPWNFDTELTATNGDVGLACVAGADVVQLPANILLDASGPIMQVQFIVCPDSEIEEDMTVEVTLTPTGAFEPGQAVPATATVLIRDDDDPPAIALQTDAAVVEGTGGGRTTAQIVVPVLATDDVPLYLTHLVPLVGDGDVLYGPLDTCGPLADLPLPNSTINGRIRPGDTEVVYEVEVCADADPESDEVARFQVMNKEETRALGQVALTIVDDDTTDVPVIVTRDIDVVEGDATLVQGPLGLGRDISPTLDVAATARIDQRVVIEQIGGDAAVGVIGLPPGEPACIGPSFSGDPGAIFPDEPVDLIATTLLPITVATGSSTFTVPLVVCGDLRPEADETARFRITLFDPLDPSPPVLGEFVVTVRDDDTDRPVPDVSIDDRTIVEGSTDTLRDARPIPITIDVPGPIDEPRIVVLDVSPDAIGGPNLTVAPLPGVTAEGRCAALPVQQDIVLPLPFLLPAGVASVETQVGLCADRVLEPDEQLRLRLRQFDPTDPQSSLFDPTVLAEFVVTVVDDDELVLDVDPIEVIEGTADWVTTITNPTRDPALDIDISIGIAPAPAVPSLVLVEPVGGEAAVGVAPREVGQGDLGCLGPVGSGEPGVILPDEPVDLVALVAQPILVPADATEIGLRVSVCPDHRIEPDEVAEFRIVEWNPTDPNATELGRFTVTIVDDDAGRVIPDITVEDITATEGGPIGLNTATATIIVNTPPSVGFLASLDVDPVALGGPNATVHGLPGLAPVVCPPTIPFTPGADAALPIPFVIPADATTVEVPITICGDLQPEPTERVRLRVREFDPTDPQLTILDPILLDDFVLTIEDDDVLPDITPTGDADTEGQLLTATFRFDQPLQNGVTLWAGTRVVGPQPIPGDALIPCTGDFVPLEPFFTPAFVPAGATEFTIDVSTCDDLGIEPDEAFLVDVYDAPEFGNLLATARMTILDDDEPELRGIDMEVAEEAGTAEVRFVVDRPAGSGISLWARTSDGTATAGDDFAVPIGGALPIVLAPDSTAPVIVPITILDDVLAEPPQDFTVGLYDNPFGGRRYAEATVTIIDTDRNTPILASPPPVEFLEDDSVEIRFDVVEPATGSADLVVGVRPAVPGRPRLGTCLPGTTDDVFGFTGPRQLAPNVVSLPVNVIGCDDLVIEDDVTFEVVISTDTGIELAAATVTMLDDDAPPIVDLQDASLAEGDPVGFSEARPVDLEVVVLTPPLRPYSLVIEATGSGSAENGSCAALFGQQADYSFSVSQVFTVQPGPTDEPITVRAGSICTNTLQEPDVTYGVRVVDGPGESGGVSDSATVTIVDDDDTVVLSVLDAQVVEGDGGVRTVEVEVEVTGTPQTPLDLRWSTQQVGGGLPPATEDVDYVASSGIAPPTLGGGTRTIEFDVLGDAIVEGDEWFEVEITSTNATVVDGIARVRIVDDEQVSVSIADAESVLEGDEGDTTIMTFDVTVSHAIGRPVTVSWATNGPLGDAPGPFPATGTGPDADFVGAAGDIVFQPGGAMTQTVTIDVLGDTDQEVNERIYVDLTEISGPGSPSIEDGRALGRILNDDELVFSSPGPPLTVSGAPATTVAPGTRVTVEVAGLAPGLPVLVEIRSTPRDLAIATTDENGSLVIDVTIPLDMPLGEHTIVVTGLNSQGHLSEILYPVTIFDEERCTVTGSNRGDLLFGTNGDDVICAFGGRDVVFAFGGNDIVFGGSGRDLLFGGSGDDLLLGQAGRDILLGGFGDDELHGGPGRDVLLGGPGNDVRHS